MSPMAESGKAGEEDAKDGVKTGNGDQELSINNSDFRIVDDQVYYSRILDYVRESYAEYGEDVQKDIAVFYSSRGLKTWMVSFVGVDGALPVDIDNVVLGHFEVSRPAGRKLLRELYDQLRKVVQDGLLSPRNIKPRPIRNVEICPEIQGLFRASQVLRPSPGFIDGVSPYAGLKEVKEPDEPNEK